MSVTAKMPMKFKCTTCNKIYMYPYTMHNMTSYPACPTCKKDGLLLGTADKRDLIKHPKTFVQTLFKQLSHTLSK